MAGSEGPVPPGVSKPQTRWIVRQAANIVTTSRILLLVLPAYAFMAGGVSGRWWALVGWSLLGATDYVDGFLARRYGFTPFGAFLDPLADKIYVTAVFLCLARVGIIPSWPVALMLMRELMVTELRTYATARNVKLVTTEAAKMKTNVQGWGMAVILLTDMLAGWRFSLHFFYAVIGLVILVAVVWSVKLGHFGYRAKSTVFWIGLVPVVQTFALPRTSNLIYILLISGYTLITGWDYLARARPALPEILFGRGAWRAWLAVANSLLVPTLYVLPVAAYPISVALPILALSAEFLLCGIENHRASTATRAGKGPVEKLPKVAAQVVLGLAGLAASGYLTLAGLAGTVLAALPIGYAVATAVPYAAVRLAERRSTRSGL